jgi:serine protease Do
MKLLKFFSVLVALVGLGFLALAWAPALRGQVGQERPFDPGSHGRRELTFLSGRGSAIGISIRDVDPAEADRQKVQGGVFVEDVRPDSAAEKGGLKRADIIVEFDGEHVRSARQFSRLVQETPPGRTVKATVVRDGTRTNLEITPDDRRGDAMISGDFNDYFRDLGRDLGRLGDRLPDFNLNFDFPVPGSAGRRLGVTVEELTTQLAEYFGAKEGLLITSVTDGSAAARAGLRAGDVITSINGQHVGTRDDLLRALRDGAEATTEATIGIVRDKKDTSVKVTLDPVRRNPRGRPAD